jgi:hypothetical protein
MDFHKRLFIAVPLLLPNFIPCTWRFKALTQGWRGGMIGVERFQELEGHY